jgi:hypothetical protein
MWEVVDDDRKSAPKPVVFDHIRELRATAGPPIWGIAGFAGFAQTGDNVQDRGVGRSGGSVMTQAGSVGAVATVSTCTPCRLGIHSCCSTRLRACHCTADWHRGHSAATTPRAS